MSMATKTPNIILVMADQLAPQFLPSYGHPIVHAPTLRRLSEEGVTFDAAYTNSPLCAPSRFVMMCDSKHYLFVNTYISGLEK